MCVGGLGHKCELNEGDPSGDTASPLPVLSLPLLRVSLGEPQPPRVLLPRPHIEHLAAGAQTHRSPAGRPMECSRPAGEGLRRPLGRPELILTAAFCPPPPIGEPGCSRTVLRLAGGEPTRWPLRSHPGISELRRPQHLRPEAQSCFENIRFILTVRGNSAFHSMMSQFVSSQKHSF